MQTYNFEQAMEGVFHGLKVKRAHWSSQIIYDAARGFVSWDGDYSYEIEMGDFYAQDWVAYEGD